MFCPACKHYKAPVGDRIPANCDGCGHETVRHSADERQVAIAQRRFLIGEIAAWQRDAKIVPRQVALLAEPYEHDIAVAEQYADAESFAGNGLPAPWCHTDGAHESLAYCPDCGENLVEMRQDAAVAAQTRTVSAQTRTVVGTAPPPVAAPVPAVGTAAAAMDSAKEQGVAAKKTVAAEKVAAAKKSAAPRSAGRFIREFRPVIYENLLLFLGAFLVVAGSIYFAIYFWDRLGAYGPVLAGSLLGVYGLSFAGVGYVLQRRYRSDFSARVLYAIAVGLLPVAFTLIGEPLGEGRLGASLASVASIVTLAAIAYPATVVASSLFQREVGVPLARAFCALLLLVGFAPLVARLDLRALSLAYLYLAGVPLIALDWRIRDVGRVFEKATVIFVVGASTYALLAVALRLALAVDGGLALAELSPLVVLIAAAAIDLDVQWRARTATASSTLGVIGVLAHVAALLAVLLALESPVWRVFTLAATGLLLSVTAIRHRRPAVIHLGAAAFVASAAAIPWLSAAHPPPLAAFGGILALPLALGLTRLAARWRRGGAEEYAAACEIWATAIPGLAVLAAIAMPSLGGAWRFDQLGALAGDAPALTVLPLVFVTFAIQYRWAAKRAYLAGSVVAACGSVLAVLRATGVESAGIVFAAAALGFALAAGPWARDGAHARARGLVDAGIMMLAVAVGAALATRLGPWHGASAMTSALPYAALTLASLAASARRPRGEIAMVSVLSLAAACSAALWHAVPHWLLPGIVGVGLLVLDKARDHGRRRGTGGAQPFAGAYVVSLVALAAGLVHLGAYGFAALAAFGAHGTVGAFSVALVPPLEPLLMGLGLAGVAARHRSPWPAYAAFALFLLAGFAVPSAFDLPIRPRTAAKAVAIALVGSALLLRFVPRLSSRFQPWRRTFLDVPLHLAALAAPIYTLRLGWVFATELGRAEASIVVLRNLMSPLGAAALVMVTHASRLHGYIAAIAFVMIGPAVVAALGLDHNAMPAALAAMALGGWLLARVLARSRIAAVAVARDSDSDGALRLLDRWRLPSAATYRALAIEPLSHVGALGVAIAFALGVGESVLWWWPGSMTALMAYAGVALYFLYRYMKPIQGDALPAPHGFAWLSCAALALFAMETAHVLGYHPRGEGAAALGLGFYAVGSLLSRGRHDLTIFSKATFGVAAVMAGVAASLWIGGALALAWPWEPTTPALAALVSAVLIRPGARIWPRVSPSINLHSVVVLAGAAAYLSLAGARWEPAVLLFVACGVWALAWGLSRGAPALSRWAGTERRRLSTLSTMSTMSVMPTQCRSWARAIVWSIAALFAIDVVAAAFGYRFMLSSGLDVSSGGLLVATATLFLGERRRHRDWTLLWASLIALAWTLAPLSGTVAPAGLLAVGALGQAFAEATKRFSWLSAKERDALGHVAAAGALAVAALAVAAHNAALHGPWFTAAAALVAISVARLNQQHPHWLLAVATSLATMSAVFLGALWALSARGWIDPPGIALASLGAAASAGAWAHVALRDRFTHDPTHLASAWAGLAVLVGLAATAWPLPSTAPPALAAGLAIGGCIGAASWFVFVAYRTQRGVYGYLAQGALIAAYLGLRSSVLSGDSDGAGDAAVALAFAFSLHFLAEFLRRQQLDALSRSAIVGARIVPIFACAVVGLAALFGGAFPTLQHALLAETIAILYTLGFRGGGHRSLGLIATVFYNAGLALLWMHTARADALFYTIPTGASALILARIYRSNLSANARRGLRTAGCLLIYASTYYQAVQFTSGAYPLLLGALALIGVGLGYFLQLRDLFFLSAGFVVLNVISNLTYYGVHKPVMGWTLLTATGLLLTAGGVLVQLRRSELRAFVGRARTAMSDWE